MTRVFAITSSSKTVTLDPQGRGRVTFTVTNTSSEPLTARCRLAPEEPAAEGWFEPLERPERRLEPEGTEQLTVNLAVPAGTAAAGYSFRLDATSVENPDEHHVEGQSVAFEVAPPPPEKKASFPWWILIVAGVLVAGLLAWLLWPSGDPGLGESCENECADGLVCNEAKVCVGELGFAGCSGGGDCAAGLDCYEVEEGGEQVSLCLGALGFTGCGEANDCGESLVCDEATCRGGLDFACSTTDCASGLLCWDGACKVDTTGADCTARQDCAPGQSCIQLGEKKKCLRNKGQVCLDDFQCASLNCDDGKCVQLAAGVACVHNAQCQSGWCDDGKCRKIGKCRSNADCPSWMSCDARARQIGDCKRRLGVAVPAFQNPNVLFELETFRESRERELRHLAPGVVTPPPRQN